MTQICPGCGKADRLTRFVKRLDIDHRQVEIDICTHCLVLANVTDLEGSAAPLSEDDPVAGGFYQADSETIARIPDLLDQGQNVITFMTENLSTPLPEGALVDLGAGLGHVAAAGKPLFGESWALDFNVWTLNQMAGHYPDKMRPRTAIALHEVTDPVSVVIAWHSLQEMTSPHQVAIEAFNKLQPGGALFLQVPAYRDAYVVRAHITFFNECALRNFCSEAGFIDVNVWHDEDLQFLTCLARKPS